MAFEENEISIKSKGGTELSKRSLARFVPSELSEQCQIIASRLRELEEDKIRIYWLHDLAEDPEINHLKNASSRSRFHKFVFVSNWQKEQFVTKLGMPQDEKMVVIENPIEPIEVHQKPDGQINLVYFSTPQRGLQILVPVFMKLAEKYDNIHLHVYSSFKIYGWEEADKNFEPLYEQIRSHPQMTYHGFAEQEVLRNDLKNMHILAYPSIWQETSCRVLIESMSAGLLCVHPNLAALAETSGGLTSMYQYQDNINVHANMFYTALENAINNVNNEAGQNYLRFVKGYADTRFNLSKIGSQWSYLLMDLVQQYPNAESRKLPSATFSYRIS